MTQGHRRLAETAGHCPPWRLRVASLIFGLLALDAGHGGERSIPDSLVVRTADTDAASRTQKAQNMWMTVGERRFAVTLADTDAARAFAARLPLTLDMTDLNRNEKKFDLAEPLPSNPSRPGTLHNGDLMLWGANTVVVFYLSFDSPYSYTRLGRIDDPNGLAQALGPHGVKLSFTLR